MSNDIVDEEEKKSLEMEAADMPLTDSPDDMADMDDEEMMDDAGVQMVDEEEEGDEVA